MSLVEKALAQTTSIGVSGGVGDYNEKTISDVAGNVVSVLTMVAGAAAVIYLIYSGILYLTAAGNPDAAKKGQQGIINAIIGIIVIVAARIIIGVAVSTGGSISN